MALADWTLLVTNGTKEEVSVEEALARAREMLADVVRPFSSPQGRGKVRVERLALGPRLGQCCGGAVTVVTEVYAHAPVGPVADDLVQMGAELKAAGITLCAVRRNWDEDFWPHATKGFFPFKEQIPAILQKRRML